MKRNRRWIIGFLGLIAIFIVLSSIPAYKIVERKAYIWLPAYFKHAIQKNICQKDEQLPKHIMFLFVDHFEPRVGQVGLKKERERMNKWMELYPQLVSKHFDSDGRHPQHTWFYPYDEINMENLKKLSLLCYEGYGEIELHLHHSNDTSKSLTKKLKDALASYSRVGALITAEEEPEKVYGFIHGNWALDNSRLEKGRNYCGVNNELEVLSQTGCYADFTFPAVGMAAQPSKINSIYYAKDTPAPKSYNRGIDVKVGYPPTGDLMIVEGPLTIDWKDWRHKFYPVIEDGDIAGSHLPANGRVDVWIDSNIHVIGHDNWIFVKIFTHGAEDKSLTIVLGEPVEKMYSYLGKKYNDGNRYRLHYVTARETYNIIKAAEAGKTGNPNDYRDFIIKPYANTKIKCNRFYRLISYEEKKARLEILEEGSLEIEFKEHKDFQIVSKTNTKSGYIIRCRFN